MGFIYKCGQAEKRESERHREREETAQEERRKGGRKMKTAKKTKGERRV